MYIQEIRAKAPSIKKDVAPQYLSNKYTEILYLYRIDVDLFLNYN